MLLLWAHVSKSETKLKRKYCENKKDLYAKSFRLGFSMNEMDMAVAPTGRRTKE